MPEDDNMRRIMIGGINTTNQSGGNNTQNINLGAPDRHLTDEVGRLIMGALLKPVGSEFDTRSTVGDIEANNYQREIEAFLVARGYKLRNSTRIMQYEPLARGVTVFELDSPPMISVGPK